MKLLYVFRDEVCFKKKLVILPSLYLKLFLKLFKTTFISISVEATTVRKNNEKKII